MQIKKDSSSPKKGMIRDKAPFDLDKMEYSFSLNANFQDEHGSGQINLQNEPSNIYCSGFKDGYKVIGHKFDISEDRTYFFLTNPDTGCSEIGYIDSISNVDGLDAVEQECDCKISVILENPLEGQTQSAICSYNTLITDFCDLLEPPSCTGCLNFNIDHPIYESNIHIKDEKTGKVLYWTDFLNPQRYLRLDYLDEYTQDIDPCTGDVAPTCLQCDKLRIFKLFDKPCLTPRIIQNGGNLKMGVYEVITAYSTQTGDEISNYYALTNPIPVYDKNNNILDQTNLDSITNFAIGVDVEGMDTNYEYYKIVVIYRSGLDGSVSAFDYGVFPIDNSNFSITTLVDKSNVDLLNVLGRRPFYTNARGMAQGNGYLYQYGMKSHPEINLQPVVNLLGSLAKWSTIQADETIYEDGVDISNYLSFMRDEVYPFSIKLFMDGGFETANFPFIARPPKDSEIEVLGTPEFPTNNNTDSILDDYNGGLCFGNIRDKRWQFENTAEVLGRCEVPANTGVKEDIEIRQVEVSCFVEDSVTGEIKVVDQDAGPNQVQIDSGTDLVTYINQNIAEILTFTDPAWANIQAILSSTYPLETCTPDYETNCDNLVLDSIEILALNAGTETEIITSKPFSDYDTHPSPPDSGSCSSVDVDISTGNPIEDSTFESTYMRASETVYQRVTPISNDSCVTSNSVAQYVAPPNQVDSPFYIVYDGALESAGGISNLQQSGITISATDANLVYTDKLHTNARWYIVPFNGLDQIAIELSPRTCSYPDDVSQDTLRVSTFADCTDASDVSSVIITDMTLVNDSNKFIVLDASNYGGNTSEAYIAIDTPIETDVRFDIEITNPSLDITLTGTSGTANVSVDGTNYLATFNTDLTTTASDFVTAHAANILATHSVIVTANSGVLTFEGADPLVPITITNASGDLDGTAAFGSMNITIDGTDYLTTYDTNLSTTAANFITDHQADLLSNQNIEVVQNTSTLEFRSTQQQYDTLSITTLTGTLNGNTTVEEKYHVLQATCGCANIYTRPVETVTYVEYTDLDFGKKMNYTVDCEFTVPVMNGCDPIPYEYGLFSYWESTENYPCNPELFDSSNLVIRPSDFPNSVVQTEFEDYYTNGLNPDGSYILKNTNFQDTPIRHYKFPCSTIVPFMSTVDQNPGDFKKSVVYPIGFSIDNQTISAFLDIAVNNGLLTAEQRSRINKYEIYRGDRSVDKSIIAKGLLFDTYRYNDTTGETVYYPNYPLNSLGVDQLNGNVQHPFGSESNRWFTFHSPETHFYKPTLPRELKVEGYQFGKSASYFDTVLDHPTYVLLGDKAYNLATSLAIAEVFLKISVQSLGYVLEATAAGTLPGVPASIIIAGLITASLIGGTFEVGQVRYQWLEIFRNLGHPHQFAYYQAAIGHYNTFLPNPLSTEILRGLPVISYLKDGRFSIENEPSNQSFNFNNLDREDSVFLTLGESHSIQYPPTYINYDNTSTGSPSRTRWSGTGASGKLVGNAASPYASLKQYLPAQYGDLPSIKWVHTGFCGDLSKIVDCDPVFGGDTYISRFSLKRKFPFFTANSHGLAPLTPFKYSDYFNVNPNTELNRYFIDYLIQDDSDNYFMLYVFPSNRSKYNLDYDAGSNFFFIKPPAKFYLFSYGFPHFLVESAINCNFRYAGIEKKDNFYPNTQNVIDFTQESNVSIREPNTYLYNFVYSSLPTNYPWRTLPLDYNEEEYSKLNNLENTVIYSKQDNTENSLTDPWLLYRALDFYGFPTSFGKLIDMDSIESEQIFARFETGFSIFGSIDQIRDRITPETQNLGNGGIFAGRTVSFNKTDLGYAGSQHKAKVSCEFGHFWADAKRGQVFNLAPNASGISEITQGLEKWFKENLPFKISQSIQGITQEALDNNFKGLGITMGWDSRSKRVFLTKLDYRPIVEGIEFIDNDFYIDIEEVQTKIELTDTDYFEDCSFTIAYSPLTKSWISYYSFKPNYYIGFDNYFQTGVNYSVDSTELGLWSHLPFLTSYQVFYGKIYPFIIESAIPSKGVNSVLHSIEYWMDVRKYYNKYDYADVKGVGFNKAFIYNMQQNSGQLNLVTQKGNDASQLINYPKFNTNSIDILQSEISGKWSFNYLYNSIRNESSGLPIWLHDCNQIGKVLNNKLLDYRSTYKDRLRGDYFLMRLQQDIESRFKMIYRFSTDKREYYQQ